MINYNPMSPHVSLAKVRINPRRAIFGLAVIAAVLIAMIWWWRTRPPRPLVRVVTLGGDGPSIASEKLSDPFGVAIDNEGRTYISDGLGGRIFRIENNGQSQVVASGLDMPSAIAFDIDGSLIIANTGAHTILRLDPSSGKSTIVAGVHNRSGDADGRADTATFAGPVGVAIQRDGQIVVADTYNDRIRVITPTGDVRTVAGGNEPGYRDGRSLEARFDTPCGIASGSDGTLFVADTGNNRVRRISRDGTVTTLTARSEPQAGGAPMDLSFDEPIAMAVRRDGVLFVANAADSSLHSITFGETTSLATVAGGSFVGRIDGPIEKARFNRPSGLAFAPDDALVVADNGNGLVRILLPQRVHRSSKPPMVDAGRPVFSAAQIRAAVPPRWPFNPPGAAREIAGTFGEIRGEALPDHDMWFHSGLDIPGGYGEQVAAVFSEQVTLPLAVDGAGGSRERIRLPVFGYIHIRVGRDANDRLLPWADSSGLRIRRDEEGRINGIRIRRGARIQAGEPLGTLNNMNHVHLVAGAPGQEVNALAALSLPNLHDRTPPVIEDTMITDDSGQALPTERIKGRGRTVVSNRIRIIVQAYDQIDGNAGYRRLAPYRFAYQVLDSAGIPLPRFGQPLETIVFDRLPSDPSAVSLVYAEGSRSGYEGKTIFAFVVTNEVRQGEAREGFLDTSELTAGEYTVRVLVSDFFGNRSQRDVPIRISR